MNRAREKRISKIYKSFVGYNNINGKMDGIHRVRPEFLKALEIREVLRGAFW